MLKHQILIIEDDGDMILGLKRALETEGYYAIYATDGERGLKMAIKEKPSLILLDIMLPKKDGYDVCKELRARGYFMPIIMLTAKGEEVDKVLGFELGADDYLTKPFSIKELLARIKSILRRINTPLQVPKVYNFGDIGIDFEHHQATKRKKKIDLFHYEMEILKLLIQHKDEAVTRNQILNEIWGFDAYPTNRVVDFHVGNIRKKLEDNTENPKYFLTVHGVGYKFVN